MNGEPTDLLIYQQLWPDQFDVPRPGCTRTVVIGGQLVLRYPIPAGLL